MSEPAEQDSKTEEPSDKKIQEALDKGNTAYSREAAIVSSMAGMLLVAAFYAGSAVGALAGRLKLFMEQPGGWSLRATEDGLTLLYGVFWDVLGVLGPVLIILMIMGLAASLLQNVPRPVLERIRPKLSKLSLSQGWKRIFGRQGVVEFCKSVAKLSIIGAVAAIVLKGQYPKVVTALHGEAAAAAQLIGEISVRLLAGVVGASVLLGVADVLWSRYHWRRQLMMTRQEVKDEQKQADGDPLVKSRLRSLARDRSRKRMMAAVPQSTLIIANPTHYSIALRFVRSEGGAPVVLAKGKNLIALKIREIAEEHDIPVVEDKPLARSMYDVVEVDQAIPEDFYKAVAELIFYLSTRNKAKAILQ